MIQDQERLIIMAELIARDLKIHKHLHFLKKSGLHTSAFNSFQKTMITAPMDIWEN